METNTIPLQQFITSLCVTDDPGSQPGPVLLVSEVAPVEQCSRVPVPSCSRPEPCPAASAAPGSGRSACGPPSWCPAGCGVQVFGLCMAYTCNVWPVQVMYGLYR